MTALHLSIGGDRMAQRALRAADAVCEALPKLAKDGASATDMDAAASRLLNPVYAAFTTSATFGDTCNDN